MSLSPYRWSKLHFEPILPTVADRGYRGARFLRVGPQKWGRSSNTLDWIPDARGVVFGLDAWTEPRAVAVRVEDGKALAVPEAKRALETAGQALRSRFLIQAKVRAP